MVHRIMNAPGSPFFYARNQEVISLKWFNPPTSSKLTTLFFVTNSFINLAWLGICSRASRKGMFRVNSFSIEINLLNLLSPFFLQLLRKRWGVSWNCLHYRLIDLSLPMSFSALPLTSVAFFELSSM